MIIIAFGAVVKDKDLTRINVTFLEMELLNHLE